MFLSLKENPLKDTRTHPNRCFGTGFHSTIFFAFICLWMTPGVALENMQIETPKVFLEGIKYDLLLHSRQTSDQLPVLKIGEDLYHANTKDGIHKFQNVVIKSPIFSTLVLMSGDTELSQINVSVIPAWVSILPPLVAIGVALLSRSVLPALMFGLWLGAWALEGMTVEGLFIGLFASFEVYVANALANRDHATIMLFTFMIAGMVGVISRNGGMQGIVQMIIRGANTAKRGQLAVWSLGLVIFFDDYSNTLVVGNTSRTVTDRLRISREKLAYIVDSTAAPIATVALVSTWIGYQVSLIGDAIAPLDGLSESAYSIFLNSILYSFYPFMAILLVLLVIGTGREFGPMLDAERRARRTSETVPPITSKVGTDDEAALVMKAGITPKAINALLPIGVMAVSIGAGLFITGNGSTVSEIVGSADSYRALMWASLLSASTAIFITAAQKLLTLDELINAWVSGARFTFVAMIILVLAWSMAEISNELNTAKFLIQSLGANLPAPLLPSLVFVLAAFTAFSTGSSWGAMGILLPLVVPLVWAIMSVSNQTDPEHYYLLYSSVSGVLAGAVWGDHCSPISDTTVMSSLSAGCDHIEHVRTQLPYAMIAGTAALLFGTVPTSFGLPWWIGMSLGATVVTISLFIVGHQVEDYKS